MPKIGGENLVPLDLELEKTRKELLKLGIDQWKTLRDFEKKKR